MAATPYNPTGEYQPESTIALPTLYAWPPRPLSSLKYLFMAIGPAPSHSGFNFLEIKGKRFFTGDWYHQLHHQYFNFNYGNSGTPVDKLFGSWHDGSRDSLHAQKERLRKQRRQTA